MITLSCLKRYLERESGEGGQGLTIDEDQAILCMYTHERKTKTHTVPISPTLLSHFIMNLVLFSPFA